MAALKQSLASMEGRKKPAGRVESAEEASRVEVVGKKSRAKNPHGKSTRKKKAA
jgi:hypothetical protein